MMVHIEREAPRKAHGIQVSAIQIMREFFLRGVLFFIHQCLPSAPTQSSLTLCDPRPFTLFDSRPSTLFDSRKCHFIIVDFKNSIRFHTAVSVTIFVQKKKKFCHLFLNKN